MDLNFSEALVALKRGKRMRRMGWQKGKWIILVRGWTVDVQHETVLHGLLPVPWIGMSTGPRGEFLPWTPTQSDLLADTWGEVHHA